MNGGCFPPPVYPLSLVALSILGEHGNMDGFDAGDVPIPAPPAGVSDKTKGELVGLFAMVMMAKSPEDAAAFVRTGDLPPDVVTVLQQEGLPEELADHLDLFLGVLAAPVEAGA